MKKLLTISFLLIFFSSCGTTSYLKSEQQSMESWMGLTKAELIHSWGPPARISSDGQGGEIYTYDKTVTMGQFPGNAYATNRGISYTNPMPATITRSRMFYIHASGIIYHWLCQGRQGY
jgi:hypothetical protein